MDKRSGTAQPRETRDVVVTVTLRFPLARVIDHYRDALTPDGGYVGTLDQFIAEYAQSVANDMARAERGEAVTSWRLEEAS